MNENEIMVNEEIENIPMTEEETSENGGFGIGLIVGGLVAAAGIAAFKLVKKTINKKKARSEAESDEETIDVDDVEVLNDPRGKK